MTRMNSISFMFTMFSRDCSTEIYKYSSCKALLIIKGISLASLNICSPSSEIDDVSILVAHSNIDLLLLQETFLNSSVPDNDANINDYTMS